MIAFEDSHPSVGAAYYAAAIGLTMCCFQPVLVGTSLACGLVCSGIQRGWGRTAQGLLWQLPLVALVALVNPLFSAAGSTVLLCIGVRAVYLESLAFGACMGAMLAASLAWFSNAGELLDTERVLALLGSAFPRLALSVSMVLRQVPAVLGLARAADGLARVVLPSPAPSAAGLLRATNVAAGAALEGSLVTARSMRARGYGTVERRSVYRRFVFTAADGAKLAGIGAAVAACAFLGWVAASQFRFYPQMSVLKPWWGYGPYALFMLLPALACGAEGVRCRG